MDATTEKDLRKLGADYAAGALKYLSEERSGETALGDLAVFFGTASSDMVASMYDILCRHASPAEADKWLDKFLLLTAARVRQKGNPTTLAFIFKAERPPK